MVVRGHSKKIQQFDECRPGGGGSGDSKWRAHPPHLHVRIDTDTIRREFRKLGVPEPKIGNLMQRLRIRGNWTSERAYGNVWFWVK